MNPIWLYNIFQMGWFNHQIYSFPGCISVIFSFSSVGTNEAALRARVSSRFKNGRGRCWFRELVECKLFYFMGLFEADIVLHAAFLVFCIEINRFVYSSSMRMLKGLLFLGDWWYSDFFETLWRMTTEVQWRSWESIEWRLADPLFRFNC